jgi:thiol-disulfide isomerase/thioredoxin
MKNLLFLVLVLLIFSNAFAGRKAPYFNLQSDKINDSQNINLKQLKGKPTVLIFWGVNCMTCKSELPTLEKIYQIYKNKGIQFYTIVVDTKNKNAVFDTKKSWKITIPGLISDRTTMYKYRIVGVPIIYFLNKDLRVVRVLYGAQPKEKIEKILNSLIEENKINTK